MKLHRATSLIFISFTLLVTGCSITSRPNNHKLQLNQEVWVREGNSEVKTKAKGESIEVKDQPIYIEAPGHIGVLVVPVADQPTDYNLQLRPVEKWGGQYTSKVVNEVITNTLSEIQRAQTLLGKGNAQEALDKINALKKKYPNASYLKFIEASCLVVLGDHQSAKRILESALKEYPNHQEAQQMFIALGGDPFWNKQSNEGNEEVAQ